MAYYLVISEKDLNANPIHQGVASFAVHTKKSLTVSVGYDKVNLD